MNILIIENAFMLKIEDKYFTNSLNGEFIKELINKGHSVSYYNFAKVGKSSLSVFDLESNGVNCYPQKYYSNKYFAYLTVYLKLIPVLFKQDFVYFYYPSSLKYGVILCKIFKIKYGIYIRGMQGINNKFSHWIYKNAYTIFTVSDLFTKSVNEVSGRIVANTIRPMISYTENDIVHDRQYKEKNDFKILYLGRLDRNKGIIELLYACEQLKRKGFSFELNLVGNGEFMKETEKLITKLVIYDVVNLKGAAFDSAIIKQYYSESDIYILPTYHEGFPRTLYEAMIFGTPIITTFVGGIPTLMKDGINCREIIPKSIDSIVDKMIYAIENYEKMGKLAKNATKMVSKIVDSKRLTHAQHLNNRINENSK